MSEKQEKEICPGCKKEIVDLEDDKVYEPGDISACLMCGEWLEYDENIKLIKMKQETIDELPPDQLKLLEGAKLYAKQQRQTQLYDPRNN